MKTFANALILAPMVGRRKKKYYVVWRGHQPGVYEQWTAAKQQIVNFSGALFKSYKSKRDAELAFEQGPSALQNDKAPPAEYIPDSISVDAACSGNPGVMEYQGVHTETKEKIFKRGPFPLGTNNVGEFLALVHALAMQKKEGTKKPIYTDSGTAMAWVRNKKVKSKLARNEKSENLWNMIERAENWLKNNDYSEIKILKWDTPNWGEIPADFGRK